MRRKGKRKRVGKPGSCMLLSSALHMQPGLTDRLHIILPTHRTSPSENNIGTYGTTQTIVA